MPYLLIGKPCYNIYADALKKYGFTPIALEADSRLNKVVSTHADTLIFSLGDTLIANADHTLTLPYFIKERITGTSDTPYGVYPTDTAFNALVLGDKLFARLDSLSNTVLNAAKKAGLIPVNVRQGYARCSTLALGTANAAITADTGMARILLANGVDALQIEPAHIALNGCEYGFIGGASFVDEANRRIFFFGELSFHPSRTQIEAFLTRYGYTAISLGGTLTDFGGGVIV